MGMSKTGIPYGDLAWNPCGYGCSKACDGCWAKALSKRRVGSKCSACAAFEVHMHPERLDWPAKRKKPAVILVQFTGELWDPYRKRTDVVRVLDACHDADWHTYVFLTQRPIIMEKYLEAFPKNWWAGETVRHGHAAEQLWRHDSANHWFSMEPLQMAVDLGPFLPDLGGVIVGCDNRPGPPYDIKWYESIVEQCREANVPCYVKQLRIDGKLVTDPARFPEHLRVRELPWTLTTKD
jgi:protein gp37